MKRTLTIRSKFPRDSNSSHICACSYLFLPISQHSPSFLLLALIFSCSSPDPIQRLPASLWVQYTLGIPSQYLGIVPVLDSISPCLEIGSGLHSGFGKEYRFWHISTGGFCISLCSRGVFSRPVGNPDLVR